MPAFRTSRAAASRRQRPARAGVVKPAPQQGASTLQGASPELLEFLASCTLESVGAELDHLMANEVSAHAKELDAQLAREVSAQAADYFAPLEAAGCYEAAEAFVEETLRTRTFAGDDDDASTVAPDSEDELCDLAGDDDEDEL